MHDVEGMKLAPPQKTATPYGGRLSWRLPGGNLLVVHLKDKLKVSKKKRWSMVRTFEREDLQAEREKKRSIDLGDVHVLLAGLSDPWSM